MSHTTRRQRRPMIVMAIIAAFAVPRAAAPITARALPRPPQHPPRRPIRRHRHHEAARHVGPPRRHRPRRSRPSTPPNPTARPRPGCTWCWPTFSARTPTCSSMGLIAVNGGQAQVNVPVGYVTAYLYLPPGTHRVALTPTGKGLAQALVEPFDVPMVAGHRYLVAFMGQIADQSLKPLVIDETKAAADIGATPSDPVTITLNNLVGATSLDYEWAGKVVNADIPFGGFAAGITPGRWWPPHRDREGHERHRAHRRGQLRRPGRLGVRVLRTRLHGHERLGSRRTPPRPANWTSSTTCTPSTPRT